MGGSGGGAQAPPPPPGATVSRGLGPTRGCLGSPSISRAEKFFLRGVRFRALGLDKVWNSVLFYPKKELRARDARRARVRDRRHFRRNFLGCQKSSDQRFKGHGHPTLWTWRSTALVTNNVQGI